MVIRSAQQENNLSPFILDGIPDPIIVIDEKYNVLYTNETVRGQSEKDAVGQKCYALMHGEKNPCNPCPCLNVFKTGKPYCFMRKEGDGKTEQSHLKEFRAYPIFNQGGQVSCVIEMVQDILPCEERRLAEDDSIFQEEETVSFCGIISSSKKMKALFETIRLVSASNAAVLIYGESGSGKELVARAVHQCSPRRSCPFIAIDCGALPETLLESELFGHVRGAFTGAVQNKKGLFEEAEGGTLFLDEIGDTSLVFQSKLLRVLQEGEIRPVGGNRSIKVDVRVVTATNKPMKEAIAKKTFREDLYYRLAVIPIVIPPLRERPDDIPILARHFIQKSVAQKGEGPVRLSNDAEKLLLRMSWRGNVRELENVIQRGVLVSLGAEISPESLLIEDGPSPAHLPPVPLSAVMQKARSKVEREQIIDALQKNKGNKSLAARSMGISRAALYMKLKRYQIPLD